MQASDVFRLLAVCGAKENGLHLREDRSDQKAVRLVFLGDGGECEVLCENMRINKTRTKEAMVALVREAICAQPIAPDSVTTARRAISVEGSPK